MWIMKLLMAASCVGFLIYQLVATPDGAMNFVLAGVGGGGKARRPAKLFWVIVLVLLPPGMGGFGPEDGGGPFARDCNLS